MFKAVALLKKKEGLSKEAFIEYYETRHAPLMYSLLPQMCAYRRNFIDLAGAFIYSGATAPDFDVITETCYPDQAAYDAAMAIATSPDVAARIAADEENFLDRALTRYFVVEERNSEPR
jgi:uncharacterized protein (TIGR02118 family)